MVKLKQLIILCKGDLKYFPPILSLIQYLKNTNINLIVVCSSCDNLLKENLISGNIEIVESNPKDKKSIHKILKWLDFQRTSWNIINRYPDSYIWISTGDTALALGRKIHQKKYSLQLLELYDKFPIYKALLKKYAKNAKVVIVPEYNRANVIKVWWQLSSLPIVIPNKPLEHPRGRKLPLINKDLSATISKLENKKIILYQGQIYKERNLISVAKAMNFLSKDFVLLLLGNDRDGSLETLLSVNPNLIHIPFVTPPDHLNITSHAYIGIATYDDSSLNNVFCAPNKIYEYSGFGIPMLCRDIPGLKYTVETTRAGICVDTDDSNKIIDAIVEMDKSYEMFSKNAVDFYNGIDLGELFNEVIGLLMS